MNETTRTDLEELLRLAWHLDGVRYDLSYWLSHGGVLNPVTRMRDEALCQASRYMRGTEQHAAYLMAADIFQCEIDHTLRLRDSARSLGAEENT